MRDELIRIVKERGGASGNCALIGFPSHGNIGDHVLWVAQCELLRALGMRVTYVADLRSYSAAGLKKACPSGTLFLSGGGNMGDVWPKSQELRERVICDFPDRDIVQLPQSVSFGNAAAAGRFGDLVRAHGRVSILLRDRQSVERLQEQCGLPSTLCPDAAYMLELRRSSRTVTRHARWILRNDREAGAGRVRGSRDWVERAFLAKVFPLVAPYLGAAAPRFAEAVAKILLRKGIALVSSVRVVVSDRLHAVIVSTLLGVPRVALDNSYGKVHGFMRTWFDGDPDTALATTVDEARAMADRLSTRSQ